MNKNKDDSVSAKTIEHVTIPDKIGELDFGRNRNIQVRWNVENEMKLFWNDRKRFDEKIVCEIFICWHVKMEIRDEPWINHDDTIELTVDYPKSKLKMKTEKRRTNSIEMFLQLNKM